MNRTAIINGTNICLAIAAGALISMPTPDVLADRGGGGEAIVGEERDDSPEYLLLTGVVRDFLEHDDNRANVFGHTDFERRPNAGFGQYCGNIAMTLGEDRKPVFTGEGWKMNSQWRDSNGRNICWALYDESRGDTPGSSGVSDQGGIASADSFHDWYHDAPGVNWSQPLTLTLWRQADGTYVFDDKEDAIYADRNGFFPLEDDAFGNPGGSPDRNFHFTFELHTDFVYDASADHHFKFIGDDDVWVFINDQLVIDLGGVHAAEEQYVELNRLGLEDGEVYTLDFFFAERHRTQSNFRIATTLPLRSNAIPSTTAAFD